MSIEELNKSIEYLKTNPKVEFTPYPEYDSRIFYILNSLGFDEDYLDNYSKIESKSINRMTLKNLITMYTFILRGEKYCDGHIASYVENGMLLQLAERELQILSSKNKKTFRGN